ncbi:MAG: HAD-IC family P-type ATPase [Actinobacteria bacterium]|nr:HAD-IC family P-type ATPase [Actinomycetota bacterium]
MPETDAKTVETNELQGLSGAEVAERIANGQTNAVKKQSSRSLNDIIRSNVFTRFNAILGVLFVVIVSVGHLRDALFGMVLVVNTLIGIVQELRAKRTLDRLTLLSAPRARVVREGSLTEVATDDVVLDDLIELRPGDQIVCDGELITTEGLEVDESLLTGESVPIDKSTGDSVMSGSFAVAGTGRFKATKVGSDAYATKLTGEARQFQMVSSDLQQGINRILFYVTWLMLPAGGLLLISQFKADSNFGDSISGTVAGLVGMVPEGLVLLTSVAFAVSIVTLGRRKVLVQELPAVEGLARVDVICLDKTGTLTTGDLQLSSVEVLDSKYEIDKVLGAFAANPAIRNETLDAIAVKYSPPEGWDSTGGVPFSSARKWSTQEFGAKGTWILGAPEMLLDNIPDARKLAGHVIEIAGSGFRVLLLAKSDEPIHDETLPGELRPAALIVFEETVKPDAGDTLDYFQRQEVGIKIISGDNPVTVAAVAKRVDLKIIGEPFDARELPGDPRGLAATMESNNVFGRVTPDQKKSMVEALQSNGHVVAMTGDGVNDVLALKKADMGIAMGSGAAAARSVAELVLLDNRFATLPGVVAEGRRVIANMERVANLFITKTVYSTILSIIIGLLSWTFVLLPRQFTIISMLTIGVPAFILSFEPNDQRYRPGFLKRVLIFTIPTGTIAAVAALTVGAMAHTNPGITIPESRTLATLVLVLVGLYVLIVITRPFNLIRGILVGFMVCGLILTMTISPLREFLALDLPAWPWVGVAVAISVIAMVCIEVVWRFEQWWPVFRQKIHRAPV